MLAKPKNSAAVKDATTPTQPAGGIAPAPALTLANGVVPPKPPRPLASLPGAFAMPFSDYLSHPALGRSTLDKIRKSPRNLRYYLEHGELDTPAFLRGRVAHRLLLEPKQFWLETVVWRGGDKSKGVGSATRWKAFQEENAGKDIITEGEEQVLLDLEDLFKTHPLTAGALVGAQTEAVVFFERDGVRCKARADIVRGDTIDDVKTTTDLAEFERNIYKWGYHRQGDFYTDGFSRATGREFKTFRLIAVEVPTKKADGSLPKTPVDIAIFTLGADVLEDGREENNENLARYSRCQATGSWPGFAQVAPIVVQRPMWRQS